MVSHEIEIIKNLFEGLVELDEELGIIPAMARRWRVSEDGKTYHIELREGLHWSDGTKLTAHDFVFAWHRNIDPALGAAASHRLHVIADINSSTSVKNTDDKSIAVFAIDDRTLQVKLKTPYHYFPYLLAEPITYPLPTHIIQTKGSNWSKSANLVCNGPFSARRRRRRRR
jgi:oligopeptide transport system substrate-binding protein